MSSTNLRQDKGAYSTTLRETVGPGDYMLNTPSSGCNKCFVSDPTIRIGGMGNSVCSSKLVDVDSELLNLNRKNSLCPANQYIPTNKPFCDAVPLKDCLTLGTEGCRLSNPPCTLRCSGWNRFEDLCTDPQARALIPFDFNIPSKQLFRDNHRPCIPSLVDQAVALPSAKNMDIMYRYNTCQPSRTTDTPVLVSCDRLRTRG